MQFEKYLKDLLGEKEAQNLLAAIRDGKTIVIHGPQGPTGKSTLCRVLQDRYIPAIEQFDVYDVTLNDYLEERQPNIADVIS